MTGVVSEFMFDSFRSDLGFRILKNWPSPNSFDVTSTDVYLIDAALKGSSWQCNKWQVRHCFVQIATLYMGKLDKTSPSATLSIPTSLNTATVTTNQVHLIDEQVYLHWRSTRQKLTADGRTTLNYMVDGRTSNTFHC